INFVSDFMAANRTASHADAVRAWKAIKAMDRTRRTTHGSRWADAHDVLDPREEQSGERLGVSRGPEQCATVGSERRPREAPLAAAAPCGLDRSDDSAVGDAAGIPCRRDFRARHSEIQSDALPVVSNGAADVHAGA